MHTHVHTHMHTQAPLAAKESEAADELRRHTSQLDAEAQVCMRGHAWWLARPLDRRPP